MTKNILPAILLALPFLLAGCPEPPGGTGGEPPAGCAENEKTCDGVCQLKGPSNGCGAESCDPCYFPRAEAVCANGVCTRGQCDQGWSNCGNDTGCDTHTDSDPMNCGGCGVVCSFPHAQSTCFGGSCAMLGCEDGWASCADVPPTNGCETDILHDHENCGGCGVVCGPLQFCQVGQCVTGS